MSFLAHLREREKERPDKAVAAAGARITAMFQHVGKERRSVDLVALRGKVHAISLSLARPGSPERAVDRDHLDVRGPDCRGRFLASFSLTGLNFL